jgi:predicted glycosyltransferase
MNILIDIGHPGHVHLFRHAARTWMDHGHRVIITIRDRDIIPSLLKAYGFEFTIASKARSGFLGMSWELVEHDLKVLRIALAHRADFLLGTSVSAAHVSRITRTCSIIFNEDDADYVQRFARLTYPFADAIVIPDCLRDKRTPRYFTHNSYHELAYLHPDRFQPDPAVLALLGLLPEEPFFVIRLVAFKAHHDSSHQGLNLAAKRRLIDYLSRFGRVFLTVEGEVPVEFRPYQIPIPPHLIHHALAFAAMLIADSQTMTIEAAVLGTPAIRCNTFVGRCSVIEELEGKYGLTYGFPPQEAERMFRRIAELLEQPGLKEEWASRRRRMLADKIDLTTWMVNFVENYLLYTNRAKASWMH